MNESGNMDKNYIAIYFGGCLVYKVRRGFIDTAMLTNIIERLTRDTDSGSIKIDWE